MTQERVSMRKTKEVLRLYYDLEAFLWRQVARSCNIAPSTVREYLRKAEQAGIRWPLPDETDDAALEARLFPEEAAPVAGTHPLPDMEYIHQELLRKGVTRQLLWFEYKEQHTDGYEYSQFCEIFRQWSKRLDVTLRQEHKAGEKLFVDFAGKGIDVINSATGETAEAQIFVAVLGASTYTFVLAVPDQSLPWWITCHTRAFEYYGGLPEIVVPDNLKSGVSKPADTTQTSIPPTTVWAGTTAWQSCPLVRESPRTRQKSRQASSWLPAGSLRHSGIIPSSALPNSTIKSPNSS